MNNNDQENKQSNIKSVSPVKCPHCNKVIFIVSRISQPVVEEILTNEIIEKAKETFRERMKEINFKDDKEREMAEAWVDDVRTIFGMADIEPLLKTMAMSQLNNNNEQQNENRD